MSKEHFDLRNQMMNLPAKNAGSQAAAADGGNGGDNGGAAGDNGGGTGDDGNSGTGASAQSGGSQQTQGSQTPANSGAGGDGGNQSQPEPLSEEQLLAEIRRRNPNLKINSLDELNNPPTAETEEQKRKKKKKDMIAWAIKNEKIDPDKQEKFNQDSAKSSRQLVYEDFSKKEKAKGKSPEQIDRAFKRLYHEELVDENDPEELELRQIAQEKMDTEAKRLLRKNYPEFYTIEKEYDKAVAERNAQVEQTKTFNENARKFEALVEKELNETTKIAYTIGSEQDGTDEEIEFEFQPEVIAQLRKEFLSPEIARSFIANYDEATVQGALKYRLLELTEKQRIAAVAKRYASKQREKQKFGRNNLTPDGTISGNTSVEKDMEVWNRLGGHKEVATS